MPDRGATAALLLALGLALRARAVPIAAVPTNLLV
jgi:hypothetical protein